MNNNIRLATRLLQFSIAICGCVPVFAGLAGVVYGPHFIDNTMIDDAFINPINLANINLDSHFRYLSGILLAIGIAFWSLIPSIETKGAQFRMLTLLVFIGGLGRAVALLHSGTPSHGMLFGLMMELVITPALCYWQSRIAKPAERAGMQPAP